MRIHKIDAASKQLDVAIELFYSDGDLCSVVTLAGVAEEIFGAFLRRQSKDRMLDRLVRLDAKLNPESPTEFKDLVKQVNLLRNSLKHANDPSEDYLDVSRAEALCWLARAIANFAALRLEPSPAMFRVVDEVEQLFPT